jgi:glyoxylate reductase
MARLEGKAEVVLVGGSGTTDDLRAAIGGVQALVPLITDRIDRALISAADSLTVIANVGVGYNNIDVAAARERGIIVTNTPDVLSRATADLTWALILSVTRRLGEGERMVRGGRWTGWAFDQLLGMELSGKTLGIVGYGRIGREVASRASAFGMTVVHTGTSEASLPIDKLLAISDIVSLHVPLRAETTHLINQAALARMKRTAYLINTARGPVIDESALVWALRNRMIAGAALDVYEQEPTIHPDLCTFENVVLAPHLGSATTETRTAMAELAVRNALAVLAGEAPLTPVP